MGRPDLAEGYEHSDLRAGVVLAGGAALVVILAVVLIATTLFEANVTGVPLTLGVEGARSTPIAAPPEPQLEAQPGNALQTYLAEQGQALTTYRWVDRQAGVVAIPIDRAMELIAERGLPSRAVAADLGDRAPSMSSSGRVDEAYP